MMQFGGWTRQQGYVFSRACDRWQMNWMIGTKKGEFLARTLRARMSVGFGLCF